MEQLIINLASGLVDNKDAVKVTADAPKEDKTIVYHLSVAPDDMGRVIGKQGRIAKAIRTVVRAAASKKGMKVVVEIDWLKNWPLILADFVGFNEVSFL